MAGENPLKTGGRMVVDAIRAHGVDRIFCVPGESYLEILDALYDANDIAVTSCRHEHGAANMAEVYGKLTGRPGVCMVTRGPGACNASIGVHTAFQDSTPMILLVGQVPREYSGREAFQEVDHAQMFAPLAKWAVQVERASELPSYLTRAFHVAMSGRPGPVVIALPEDMLVEKAPSAEIVPLRVTRPGPTHNDMAALRNLLNKAQRPFLFVGGGSWTEAAKQDIVAFAAAQALPTVCSFRRHDIFDNRHPNFAGEFGLSADPKLTTRIKQSDLVIAVGTRLGEKATQDYSLFESPNPKQSLVHVHLSALEIGRVFRPTLGIESGMAEFASAVSKMSPAGAAQRGEWVKAARRDYEANSTPPAYPDTLDLGRVMVILNTRLAQDAMVSVDAGNYSGWPQRFLRIGRRQRLLGPTSGAMGYAVPAAVAAKIMHPNRQVIACVGDGGFGMTGQELATAVLYGAAPIILVFNNRMYGTIRMHQEREYPQRVIGTDLANPDFAALARSYGAHGEAVAKTSEFEPAFDRAVKSGKAAVIELRMDPARITTRSTIASMAKAPVRK